jgi:hypothetical protein
MTRIIWITLLWLAGARGVAAAEGDCVDLTNLDEAQLASYEFAPAAKRCSRSWTNIAASTGEVRVVVQPIFDPTKPSEDRWLYRQANRWHSLRAIDRPRHLFRTDSGARGRLREQRILRGKSYLATRGSFRGGYAGTGSTSMW